MKKVRIDRRKFMQLTALGGGAFVLGIVAPGLAHAAQAMEEDCEFFQPNAYIRIEKDGSVTVFVAKQESGQGVDTALPMIVAEELEVDFADVRVAIASYGSLPEDLHDTGGSQSVKGSWEDLRKAGAVCRTLLISAAARRWGVAEHLCTAERGFVVQAVSGARLKYGDLVCDAAQLPVPETVVLKSAEDYRIIGKAQRNKHLEEVLTGKAIYGIDLVLPGMLYAVVERCPVRGGSIVQVDAAGALAVPGVQKVVRYDGTQDPMHVRAGVAVVADTLWAAMKGRRLLKIQWDEGTRNGDSTEALFRMFAEKAGQPPVRVVYEKGDVDAAASSKARVWSASYAAPFLAHAAMEPPNFIAAAHEGGVEIWGGLQLPKWAVETISKDCGIPKDAIKVNLVRMGGAFGRRLQFDFAIEAVKIAQQLDRPVKVIWDRTDDIRFDNYRPANYHRLQARYDASGRILSWEHHVLSTPIEWSVDTPETGNTPSENVGGADKDFWYDIPNIRTGYTPVDMNIQRGWLRGVEPVQNVFAVECFIDELARSVKKDPLAFRLSLLEGRPPFEAMWDQTVDPGRLAGVLQLAADRIGWSEKRRRKHYVGIAGHMFFCDSYAAHAIEIELLGPKKFRMVKIVCAIDCGQVINPDGLRSQMEGGTVFGLGQALRNEITVAKSRVQQDGFFTYELARFSDVPPIEVHVVPSTAPPGGAGEVGVATVSPALCNALAAAGYRPRVLPIRKEGFSWV